MSILIKGVERPKNCAKCGVEWCERWRELIISGMSIAKSRPSNCPLIEVPTPHGRLIDADKLFAKIPEGDIEHDVKISRTGAIADVCTWVLTAPTIIEAEEGEA